MARGCAAAVHIHIRSPAAIPEKILKPFLRFPVGCVFAAYVFTIKALERGSRQRPVKAL
jgi:hypothetical protein